MDYHSLSLEGDDQLVNTQGGIVDPNSDNNLDMPKFQKTRALSDIYIELGGSSDDVTSSRDWDSFLDTRTLKSLTREFKGKRKKPVSEESRRKKVEHKELGGSANEDSKTGDFSSESNYNSDSITRPTLNRNRRVFGQRTSKRGITISVRSKRLGRKTRTALASSSVGDEENTSRTSEIFSNNTETATGSLQNRTRQTSPPSDRDFYMGVEALLQMSNGEVQTDTLPRLATKEQAKLCEVDGHLPAAIGSGSAQEKETEHGISVCAISRNPAEFAIEGAKKYMRWLK